LGHLPNASVGQERIGIRDDRVVAAVVLLLSLAILSDPGSAAAICPGTRYPVDRSIGETPLVRIALGNHVVTALLDTGATESAVEAWVFGLEEGEQSGWLRFSFPTLSGGNFTAENMSMYRAPPGGRQARIGTDILNRRMLEFHYETAPAYALISGAACDPGTLRSAGFVAIGLPGYYATDPNHLAADKPNVPVIGLRIGDVDAPAQIDTGFADEVHPGTVQVNTALLELLRARGVAMTKLPAGSSLGCAGRFDTELWQVSQASVVDVAGGGETVGPWPPPVLEVKRDHGCGGIETFGEPWAQLGASWLGRWRTTVIDGPGEQVWVRR
jgi:hypothetical protein